MLPLEVIVCPNCNSTDVETDLDQDQGACKTCGYLIPRGGIFVDEYEDSLRYHVARGRDRPVSSLYSRFSIYVITTNTLCFSIRNTLHF